MMGELMHLASTQGNRHTFLAQSSTSGELTIWLQKQALYPPFEMLDELEVL